MRKNIVILFLFVFDFTFLIVFYIALAIFCRQNGLFSYQSLYPYPIENAFVFLIIITLMLIYEKIYIQRYDFWEETRLVFRALFLSFAIILSFLMLAKIGYEASRGFLLSYFFGLILFFPVFKRLTKKYFFKIRKFKKRVKIIGNTMQSEQLACEFTENWYLGYLVVKNKPEAIFIASKELEVKTVNHYIKRYSKNIKEIYVMPFVENINFSQSRIVEYFNIRKSVIKIENNLLKKSNIILKAVFEKISVVCILPFFLILHLFIIFLLKRDSKKGPIFFIQERIGLERKPFLCLKYRTMLDQSDAILQNYLEKNPKEKIYYEKYHKYINDPRITPIGGFLRKTSLDELPQLLNVLKGEMSLIGPRPYMYEEEQKIGQDAEMIFRVKPGISGLWQVSGRNELSFAQRKELDVWYIQNWSLWMDIVILLKTLKVVLIKKGAK